MKENTEKGFSVAIVGSRTFNNYSFLKRKIEETTRDIIIEQIISGGAKGADKLAEQFAKENNIPIKILKPDWKKGKWAGFERNTNIINQSDIVFAFYNGTSKGTLDSIKKAEKLNKKLYIFEIN